MYVFRAFLTYSLLTPLVVKKSSLSLLLKPKNRIYNRAPMVAKDSFQILTKSNLASCYGLLVFVLEVMFWRFS